MLNVLRTRKIEFVEIDITDPTKTDERDFMWEHGKKKQGSNAKPMPPQCFNDDILCGVGTLLTH